MRISVRNSVMTAPVSSFSPTRTKPLTSSSRVIPATIRYGELSRALGQDIFEGVGGLAGQLLNGVAHLGGIAIGTGASVLREE